jgi:hypothetical protein
LAGQFSFREIRRKVFHIKPVKSPKIVILFSPFGLATYCYLKITKFDKLSRVDAGGVPWQPAPGANPTTFEFTVTTPAL